MLALAKQIQAAVTVVPGGAKRRATKDAIQKWYPYYAGYSTEFAVAVLRAAKLPVNATILDPWNGSGTTTLAAAKLGLAGRGFDLNPVAVMVARARLVNAEDAKGVRGFIRNIGKRQLRQYQPSRPDPLNDWLPSRTVAEFRWLQREVTNNFATPSGHALLDVADGRFSPLASFLLLGLVRAAKSLVAARATSNPTIFRRRATKPKSHLKGSLFERWLLTATQMGDELPLTSSTPKEQWVSLGDARHMNLPPGSVDFVLTSPPYCTRLDYADATRFELAATQLMTEDPFAKLRRELMGAPIVRERSRPAVPDSWPESVKRTLASVRGHNSKASDSYYYKTYHQYFSDALRALASIRSCLKAEGTAALVLQDSYYKEIHIDLPNLYVDMGSQCGLRGTIACDIPVRTVLASINPGTKTYRKDWTYRESIVLLRSKSNAQS